ncbi:Holliday junction resolvase RuvX [Candidatus Saccharibacteria bacterium]|jgi:putative Holliday junction resolvase|nr:Holliday junction resolvase RuvX [Candidatus Saccharibacteria bacterium]
MSTAVLGIDYGEKRIGIARASRVARLPEPLLTITNSGDVTTKIKQLASEEDATTLVVGLPRSLEGVDTEQTKKTRLFMEELREAGFVVVEQDEAVTSEHAISELQQTNKHFAKGDVDSLAAVYILEDYLQEEELKNR